MTTRYIIEKVGNMVFISSLDNLGKSDIVFEAWDETEFTERKCKNAMKRIQNNHQNKVEFIRTF